MRVYITDLEAYNNGHLVGDWYELPMDADTLAECDENVLHEGRNICKHKHHHEETFITDFECDYMEIGEYDDIYKLNEIAQEMEELSECDLKKYTAMIDAGYTHKQAIEGY